MKLLAYVIASHNFQRREPLTIDFQPKKRGKTKTAKQHEKILYISFVMYMYLLIFHFSGTMY